MPAALVSLENADQLGAAFIQPRAGLCRATEDTVIYSHKRTWTMGGQYLTQCQT